MDAFILIILFLIIVWLITNYNWLLIIAVAAYVLDYSFKQLNRKKIITIDATGAVFKHKMFGELAGIKSATEGKDYDNWTKNEKEKYEKICESSQYKKANVSLTYLPSEDAYYVNNRAGSHYIAFRGDEKNCIYSAVVLGDENHNSPFLEFLLYEKNNKLVPCLEYRKTKYDFKLENKSFDILCEFPPFLIINKEKRIKKLGFELDKIGGDDVYTDDFGVDRVIPVDKTYRKNGVWIDTNY